MIDPAAILCDLVQLPQREVPNSEQSYGQGVRDRAEAPIRRQQEHQRGKDDGEHPKEVHLVRGGHSLISFTPILSVASLKSTALEAFPWSNIVKYGIEQGE